MMSPPLVSSAATTLPASMTLPPPMPTTRSQVCAAARSTASRTRSVVGSRVTRNGVWATWWSSRSRSREACACGRPPVSTKARRPRAAASRPSVDATPAPKTIRPAVANSNCMPANLTPPLGRFNRLTFFGGKLTKSGRRPAGRDLAGVQPWRLDWKILIPRLLARMLKKLCLTSRVCVHLPDGLSQFEKIGGLHRQEQRHRGKSLFLVFGCFGVWVFGCLVFGVWEFGYRGGVGC